MNNKNPSIYPLSPLNNLNSYNYQVYKKYLSDALRNNRVKNIAITGDFGIGKSSILNTFCKETNNNFMFLSLAEYNNRETQSRNEQLDIFGNTSTNNKKDDASERNKFEASLLRQIISLCHKEDIPLSGLKLVPEESTKSKRTLLTLLLCIDIIAIYFVAFSKHVSAFFHNILGQSTNLHHFHLLLYLIIIILSVYIFGRIFFGFISKAKLKEVSASVNGSKSEISAIAENTEYCLERNSLELSYIFEMLSKEYDAIIFEDMDRIDHKITVEILTCLREINNTVNERLRAKYENKSFFKKFINTIKPLLLNLFLKNKLIYSLYIEKNKKSLYLRTGKLTRKKLCFIFVINEEMIADFDYNKYIDYGLTVVPELGSENAVDIITDLINDLELAYDVEFVDDLVELTKEIPKLRDYRTLNQIRNEYNVFKNVLENKIGSLKNFNSDLNEKQLLVFIIYKNLLPDDYNRIRKNNSVLFHNAKYYNNNKCYSSLIDFSEKGYLKAACCLQFMGFSEIEKINICKNILLKSGHKRKRKFFVDDMNGERIILEIIKKETMKENIKKYLLYIEDNYLGYLINNYLETQNSYFTRKGEQIAKTEIIEFIALVSDYYLVNKRADEYLLHVLVRKIEALPNSIIVEIIKYFIIKQYKNYNWITFEKYLDVLETLCKQHKDLIIELVKLSNYNFLKIDELKDNQKKYPYLHSFFYS